MAEKKFSIGEAIKFGWQTMKQNFWFFAGLLIITGLIFIVPDVIADLLEEESQGLAFAVSIAGSILSIVIIPGLVKISLNFCDNVKSEIIELFSQYRLFFKFLFASILYVLIVIAGSILLILPGIYLAIRLQFYKYFIVDKQSRITESLKRSWQVTQGSFWNLFLLGLLLGLINLAGFLVFLVGLFVTVPTTIVAVAFVYRKLLGMKAEAAQAPTAPAAAAVPHGPTSPMTPPPPAPTPMPPAPPVEPPPSPPPPAQSPMIPPSSSTP